ncbi:energy-coupling factor ABC transporter ATP-binding protein [Methanimicrococcus blatticola]|uniref:ABC transporter ATP-binding protein n=1 Tax=Methanimicrococcus blatticola TaxID=91560 RepID=A0A484F6P0_9EURY|nr:ATP-binding cassette domain-containing protein [Methanimicrococcus blatticola]MBZ3934948.1 ATP-binding cassette domain-containing protein [Methanimicrococcus blatticola]MCC2508953.1 ATP-binding cassette domain-containing protein [Methanimicrococcus blatticola]TDQ71018.1 cobalt/nickel transport system ATP-binding protein [Methanimicrococcus blatticola]
MILETKNLEFSYPDGTKAVDDISITIPQGKKVSFVGKNGSGKSTLFLLLNGTLKPKKGKVLFGGKEVDYSSSGLRELRKKVGIVFQNSDDQLFAPTVYQDIAFGPLNLGYSKEEIDRVVNQMLDHFGLQALKDKPPHHLSGGQKKRVAIAGVLAMDPDIIILDEPLSNLDPVGADEILDILNELNDLGKTIIISTHDVDLAYKWSDYVLLLSSGKLVNEGTSGYVFSNDEEVRNSALKSPFILDVYRELEKRWLATGNAQPKDIPELVQLLHSVDLMRVDISPEVAVGECVNLGVLFGDYTKEGLYEAVNSRVLFKSDDGTAVVELKRRVLKPGAIHVYNMDEFDKAEFDKIVDEYDINFIGAMGKKSKDIAENNGIDVVCNSGVIDKSILNAITGSRCLILTSSGMVSHTAKRIREYIQNSGIRLIFSPVGKGALDINEENTQDQTDGLIEVE